MKLINLGLLDWSLILIYLIMVLFVGYVLKGVSSESKESYFLANRSLPWWLTGISMAATTFASDTPLAVTGIIAGKGISGNWMWMAWIGIHAAVVIYFASRWNRSGVLTDAELISVRYSGVWAKRVRLFRASLSGIVINCIVLGWVLRAMVKIISVFLNWQEWFPDLFLKLDAIWPSGGSLGGPSEGLTIIVLLLLVGIYSSMGGIRGVILTDLLQFALAFFGSVYLAYQAIDRVGGIRPLLEGLNTHYGTGHEYLDLFPNFKSGWASTLGISSVTFGVYLFVQSFSTPSADGGGYFMQRLNSTRSPDGSKKAFFLFLLIHYVFRVWPWILTALAALVLFPIGKEAGVLGAFGEILNKDREMAYPLMMAKLLSPGILGLVVASLIAAFMSTVDTHINWGASYIVNDWYPVFSKNRSAKRELWIARLSIFAFITAAVLISFQISRIELAWQWVATIGASLGMPTLLRWIWWRVSAFSELTSMIGGLLAGIILIWIEVPYEIRLIIVSGSSLVGLLLGIYLGPKTDLDVILTFQQKVSPIGLWPEVKIKEALFEIFKTFLMWVMMVSGFILVLKGIHRGIFDLDSRGIGVVMALFGFALMVGTSKLDKLRQEGEGFQNLLQLK